MSKTVVISYSQLRNWLKCPHYHKLISVTKEEDYPSNIYIVFGFAFHEAIEKHLNDGFSSEGQVFSFLLLASLLKADLDSTEIDFDKISSKAALYSEYIFDLPSLLENYEIYETEYEMKVEFKDRYEFRAYIDCILKKNGEYYIVDWKTSKSGWNKYKKEDKKYIDQIPIYRKFFADEKDISVEKVHGLFIIFSEDGGTELFSPDRDIDSALNDLENMVYNAYEKEFYPFKKSCQPFCECEKLGYRNE